MVCSLENQTFGGKVIGLAFLYRIISMGLSSKLGLGFLYMLIASGVLGFTTNAWDGFGQRQTFSLPFLWGGEMSGLF